MTILWKSTEVLRLHSHNLTDNIYIELVITIDSINNKGGACMATPYWKREKAIKELFALEEEYDIPENERLTCDPYKDIDCEPSPRKKAYVDIRDVIHFVGVLKEKGKYPWHSDE